MYARQAVRIALTSAFAVAILAYGQLALAACDSNELPFEFNVGSTALSTDSAGRYQIDVGAITYTFDTTAWQQKCRASGGSATSIDNAGKRANFSLVAFPSTQESEDGYEVARSGDLWLHAWNASPSMGSSYEGAVVVGYGRDYKSPPLQPRTTLPAGTWYLTLFLVDVVNDSAEPIANFPTPIVVPSSGSNPTPTPTPTPGSSVAPQTGLWANMSESGTGYTLDYKHGTLVVAIYAYASNGAAQWYLAVGPVTGNTFTATLDKYVGGQCISCVYQGSPTLAGNDGTITITFSSSTAATVNLPGGRVTQIQPFQF